MVAHKNIPLSTKNKTTYSRELYKVLGDLIIFCKYQKMRNRVCKGNAANLYFLDHNPHNNKQSLKATKYLCNQVLQSPFSPIQLPQTRRKQTCLTTLLLKVLQRIISDCLDYDLADEPDDILCTDIFFIL